MDNQDAIEFTVGKIDAGMAVLLTQDNQVIEFPSVLLPEQVVSGSIVKIQVERDEVTEVRKKKEFSDLQSFIQTKYGLREPSPPVLKISSVTQTSVVLEFDPLVLNNCDYYGAEIIRDNQKLNVTIASEGIFSDSRGTEGEATTKTTTAAAAVTGEAVEINEASQKLNRQKVDDNLRKIKISGLIVHHKYEFYMRIHTSNGIYESNRLDVETHKLDDLTGIYVCFGRFTDSSNVGAQQQQQQQQQQQVEETNDEDEDIQGERRDEDKEKDTEADVEVEVEDESQTLKELIQVVERIGAKWTNKVTVDVTHFVCQVPVGPEYEKALGLNIPVVKPEWLTASEQDKKLQPALSYYLS